MDPSTTSQRLSRDAAVSALLVLFLAAAIVLAATVPALYVITRRATADAHAATATVCASEVALAAPPARARVIAGLERHYGVRIRVVPPEEVAVRSASREYRNAAGDLVEVRFGDELEQPRRTFQFAAGAGATALALGIALLVMNMSRLLGGSRARPAAAGETTASDGTAGLLSTFETSIRDLKGRESELKRMHAAEKQRANEVAALSATLVRSLTSGFLAVDEHGLIVDLNQQARDLLGLRATAVSRQPILSVLGETEFGRTIDVAARNRAAVQRQEVVDPERGQTIGLTTVPLADERGRHMGMLALFTDLTPLRRLEMQIREMQSLADLGEMSAGIAHEFRNSLSAVIGYLRLARKGSLPVETDDRLRRAEDEAKLLADAVQSLLNFARPFTIHRQILNPVDILRDLAANLDALRGVNVEFAGDGFELEGDPALLQRAFENVMRNAAESMSAAGRQPRILVESVPAPVRRIAISDNGAGLDPARASKLFLPFQSTKPSGFGLGLALTKKIIVLHGGMISISGRPGEGATVAVEFPGAE